MIFPYNHLFLFYFCLWFQNFDSHAFVYCFEHRHYTNFNTFDGPYLALEFLKHWEFRFSDSRRVGGFVLVCLSVCLSLVIPPSLSTTAVASARASEPKPRTRDDYDAFRSEGPLPTPDAGAPSPERRVRRPRLPRPDPALVPPRFPPPRGPGCPRVSESSSFLLLGVSSSCLQLRLCFRRGLRRPSNLGDERLID